MMSSTRVVCSKASLQCRHLILASLVPYLSSGRHLFVGAGLVDIRAINGFLCVGLTHEWGAQRLVYSIDTPSWQAPCASKLAHQGKLDHGRPGKVGSLSNIIAFPLRRPVQVSGQMWCRQGERRLSLRADIPGTRLVCGGCRAAPCHERHPGRHHDHEQHPY